MKLFKEIKWVALDVWDSFVMMLAFWGEEIKAFYIQLWYESKVRAVIVTLGLVFLVLMACSIVTLILTVLITAPGYTLLALGVAAVLACAIAAILEITI